jgi:hypothetical protein
LGNVGALAGNSYLDGTGVAIKAFAAVIEANIIDNLAYQFIEVHKTSCGDFAQKHNETGFNGEGRQQIERRRRITEGSVA